ncbi:MAG: MFS transporter [Tissierellales bacterium]|jgi:Na+/melibiose symporter-like transporter|nr:MFS transporter [Tissierellales bacterium]
MKLNYKKTLTLGMGFFAIALVWQIYNFYVPLFLAEYIPNSMTMVNGIMTMDNVLAVTMIPIIGSLSDHTKTRFGRRMPYLLIGMPLSALFFVLIPHFNLNSGGSLGVFVILIMLYLTMMSLFRSPTIALMPDITPPELRSKANGVINFMGGFGTILALTLGAMLYKMNENYPFWMTGVLMMVSLAVLFFGIKEPEVGTIGEHDDEKLNFKQSIHDLFHSSDKTTSYILCAIFCWFVAYEGVLATFSNYCVKFLGIEESSASLYLSVMSALYMVTAIPSGYFAAKVGKAKAISMGIVGMFASFMLIGFLRKDLLFLNIPFSISMMVLMVVAGISWALIGINSYPLVVERAKSNQFGIYTGLYYFAAQSAAIVGPLLLGLVIDALGFRAMFPFAAVFYAFAFVWIKKSGEK